MKALTICQPYASLIVGWPGMPEAIRKRVENREWFCKHRGPLLIHAGQSKKWLKTWDGSVPEEMPYGVILGQVNVTGCVFLDGDHKIFWRQDRRQYTWLNTHQHATGPYCIILENPIRFETPVPYIGQRKIFEVPDSYIMPLGGQPETETKGDTRCQVT